MTTNRYLLYFLCSLAVSGWLAACASPIQQELGPATAAHHQTASTHLEQPPAVSEVAAGFSLQSVDHAWIPVPFQPQSDTGTSSNYCCGLATINMATAYVNGVSPTATYLKKMFQHLGVGSTCGSGTNASQQLKVAKEIGQAWGSYNSFLTWDQLKGLLKAGTPVVVGVDYSQLKNRCANYNGWHSLLVIGYNGQRQDWVVNDPLCRTASTGMNKRYASADFRRAAEAWARAHGYHTSGVYATVVRR